jgi:type I restriction enzyme S subunit
MMKAYPTYKSSETKWLGKIPEHWYIVKLKWVTKFRYGSSLSEEQRLDGDVPVYGSNGPVGYHNEAITDSPCIIVGRKGSFGKVNFSEKPCFPTDTTYYIDKSATQHNLFWLRYLLPLLKLDSLSQDSAVPGLSREEAYEKLLALPTLLEQQAIANYLDHKTRKIDILIEKKQRLIELLKQERTAIINQTVTKGINPDANTKDSGIEWIGEIPEHWELKRLKYVAVLQNSNVDKKTSDGEKKVLLCNYLDVYQHEFIEDSISFMEATASDGEIEKFNIQIGDVLVTKDSETPDDIAVPALVVSDLTNVICGYHLSQIRPVKEALRGEFLFRLFQSKRFNGQFEVSANGVTRFGLSVSTIADAFIPLPELDEQASIADYLKGMARQIDDTIMKNLKGIELLQEYRTALISEVVTGKIDVREYASGKNN